MKWEGHVRCLLVIYDVDFQSVSAVSSANIPAPGERRRHLRLHLRIAARLYRAAGASPVEVTTENLSIAGFSCLSREAFLPGELIISVLAISGRPARESSGATLLLCRSQVLRVTPQPTEHSVQFCVACRIRDYQIVTGLPDILPEQFSDVLTGQRL